MTAGIPVVAANRGALPEVAGTAGILVDPQRPSEIAAALEPLIDDDDVAAQWGAAGLSRARVFSWAAAAASLRSAYVSAVANRKRQ